MVFIQSVTQILIWHFCLSVYCRHYVETVVQIVRLFSPSGRANTSFLLIIDANDESENECKEFPLLTSEELMVLCILFRMLKMHSLHKIDNCHHFV